MGLGLQQRPLPLTPALGEKRENTIHFEAFFWILAVGYTSLLLILFHNQCLGYGGELSGFPSDMPAYLMETRGESSGIPFPYRFLFRCAGFVAHFTQLELAFSLVLALLCLLSVVALKYYFEKYFPLGSLPLPGRLSPAVSRTVHHVLITLAAFTCILVASLYLPGISRYLYIGQGTANVYHNATGMAAKGFGIAAFFMAGELLQDLRRRPHPAKLCLFAAVLALMFYTKPTFAPVYIPVYGLYMLPKLFGRNSWKNTILTGLAFLPGFGVLAYQYLTVFGEGMGVAPGRVWHQWTDHILLTIPCAIAFPLFMLLTHLPQLKTERLWQFAWAGYGVSFLEFYLLYEKGERWKDGNFSWGYDLAIFFLFAVGLMLWLRDWKEKKNPLYHLIAAVLLGAHLISGLLYFRTIFLGGSYY